MHFVPSHLVGVIDIMGWVCVCHVTILYNTHVMWVRRAVNVAKCTRRRMFAIHQKLRSIRSAAPPQRTIQTNNAVSRTHTCVCHNKKKHSSSRSGETERTSAVEARFECVLVVVSDLIQRQKTPVRNIAQTLMGAHINPIVV